MTLLWLVRWHVQVYMELIDWLVIPYSGSCFSRRAVRHWIDHMRVSKLEKSDSSSWARPTEPISLRIVVLDKIFARTREVRKELQSLILEYVGIVRSTTRLEKAELRTAELELSWEA